MDLKLQVRKQNASYVQLYIITLLHISFIITKSVQLLALFPFLCMGLTSEKEQSSKTPL